MNLFINVLLILVLSWFLLFSGDVLIFWLLVELVSLSLIPCFFNTCSNINFEGVTSYILAVSVSSILILVGVVYAEFFYFFLLGFMIKFGIFPFFGWVYKVFISSQSWLIVWLLSSVTKISMMYIFYFVSNLNGMLIGFVVLLSMIWLSILFWLVSHNWYVVWCHMMLSSSAILFYLMFFISFNDFVSMFIIYFFWSSCVMIYLSGSMSIYGYILWLVSFPFSLALCYKIYMGYLVLSLGLIISVSWFLYSLFEQLYLIKWLVSMKVPKVLWHSLAKVY
uniref:NADH dehydrogenase subunit 2 n=1 Tax=Schistosoma turkestanicum TaxID=1163369 RepID=G4WCQ5_9TREM|nr:NADH dehydrogenase subunit 2 [Schistosoma turkestanicum]